MSTVAAWLAAFDETVDAASFINPQVRQVAAFLRRYAADIATVIECRRDAERELIVADLLTGAPQAPVYPIRKTETVGILFIGEGGRLPFVIMLRDDFPDTEHQQIVPPDHPHVICLDDRPWAEARLTWTPAELVERILSWFRRAARGELQDVRQPLDPIFMGSSLSFVVARSILDADDVTDLIGEYDPGFPNTLRVRRATDIGKITPGKDPITIFSYRVPPERMKRLRYAPTSLTELVAVLNERGIDLLTHLCARLTSAVAAGEQAAWRLNGRLALIIEMPILSPRGEQGAGLDVRAFVTPVSAGDIAVALGIALKQESRSEGSKVGYVRAIGAHPIGEAALARIEVQSAEVHLEFERDLAARLAGRDTPDQRKALLVGAGAIGSHLADSLMREGRFAWTIIDDDRLLPHNLARHVSINSDVSRPKAAIVADHLNGIIAGRKVAEAIPANLFDPGEGGAAVERALSEADIIIDATASLVAARNLSDHPSKARRMSAFFNPSGEAAVLFAEPEDRAVKLRDLEAQYLALLLRTPRLADHLGKLAETIAYTGACRAITNRIPEWRATILSGLAAGGISYAADTADGTISVWTLAPTGEVSLDTAPVEPVGHYQAMDWMITIDAGLASRIIEMRNSRLPAETGGILFGLVDILAKSIHLVMATPAPFDSIEEPGGFVRGMGGVDEMMEDVRRRTAGQVRYVGEWHSHPPRASARPSPTDDRQLDWLAALMGIDAMPALMVIAADRELAVVFATQPAQPCPAQERG
jgi:Prokaryotic E2 family A/ThiF family/Prokaryotic homologs of the JAB domain